jgi:hypothetical protein
MNQAILNPRSIVFWRNVVGIFLLLMLQRPAIYDNGAQFLGLWLGSALFVFGLAAAVTSIAFLFLTKSVRGRAWVVLLTLSWLLSGLVLFGQWGLPKFVKGIRDGMHASNAKESLINSPPQARGMHA